jgi:S-DNA-T family DNA segregation ATPase FtsK/SpoIIIE
VAAIWPPDETPEWRWLRWLPHVWSSDGQTRALAADAAAARRLLEQVDQAASEDGGEGDDGAIWIVVIADPAFAAALPSRPGVHSVVLASSPQALPAGCATTVEVNGGSRGTLRQARGAAVTIDRVDAADVELADAFARTLAPIRLARVRRRGPLPLVVHQPLVEQVHLDGQRETLVDDPAGIAAPGVPRRG